MSTSKKKDDKTELIIAEGLAATQSARTSANMAAERFAKPENYTGNRTLYDSGSAKYHAKSDLFKKIMTPDDFVELNLNACRKIKALNSNNVR